MADNWISKMHNFISIDFILVIDCLEMPDFDRLRATASSENEFLCRWEPLMLRLTVQRLSVAGQMTYGVLQDLLQPQNWTYLDNVAGWLHNGSIGRGLNTLQERLTSIQYMWGGVLSTIFFSVSAALQDE